MKTCVSSFFNYKFVYVKIVPKALTYKLLPQTLLSKTLDHILQQKEHPWYPNIFARYLPYLSQSAC